MNTILAKERVKESITMSASYANTMLALMEAHPKIIEIEADLGRSLLAGWIPYIHSFAAFASRRVIDQVFISGCYAKANIRIIGSDPGVTSAFNGGTHMPFEDIAAYRAFPEMTILEPTDSVMLTSLLHVLSPSAPQKRRKNL